MMESKLVLAMLVRRFRIELAPGTAPGLDPGITLRPSGRVRLTVRPR